MHPVPKAPQDRSPRLQHRPRTTDGSSSSFQVIHGYRVIRDIGQGAFATVYKVQRVDDDEIFAMKVVKKSNLGSSDDIVRFQREIDSMTILRHENIVQLHDFFSDENNFYLVIDYCPNGELSDFIAKNGKINENTAALLFQQIASAISYCHSYGVAHRDLKPQNILIQKFPFVKIADFGLCGYVRENDLMKTFCGSPAFAAPECLSRTNYDGRKSDIWSLGVILFVMVTGEFPWNLSNTGIMIQQILKAEFKVPPFVSQTCKDLITSMMKENPNERISMEDILKHPFLKLAANANVVKKDGILVKPPKLPKLPQFSIEQLSKLNRDKANSDHGIFAPSVNNNNGDSSLPPLSGVMHRSMSLENYGNLNHRLSPRVRVAHRKSLQSSRNSLQLNKKPSLLPMYD